MKTFFYLLLIMALLFSFLLPLLVLRRNGTAAPPPPRRHKGFRRTWRKFWSLTASEQRLLSMFHQWRLRPRVEFCNIGEGTRPTGNKTFLADGAIATRYLLVKLGTDLNHVAVCTAITDNPIGICADEPAAAEDECNVQLFGGSSGTLKVVSGAAVVVGNYVATMANGKVQPAVSTQFVIGRALNAAAGADEIIEIDPVRSDRAL